MAKRQIEYGEDDEEDRLMSDIGDELYTPDKPDPCSEDDADYLLDSISGRRKARIMAKVGYSKITDREMDEIFGGLEIETEEGE